MIYGWAAVQYQAWARGELHIRGNETQNLILNTDGILEYWIDDQHYFGGDYYSFRRAPPVLHLKPGTHRIDLRLVRDVRAFGGILEPTIDVVVHAQQVSGTLELAKPGILMADVVHGQLASPLGSISLRNSGEDDIEVVEIRATNVSLVSSYSAPISHEQVIVSLEVFELTRDKSSRSPSTGNSTGISIVAGQTRPVAFNITLPSHNATSITYDVVYKTANGTLRSKIQVSQDLKHASIYQPHKITFLHPGGIVSYGMLRPPAKNATCRSGQTKLPVLLSLHGAGVEAENPAVTGALNGVSDLCAWVLFPSGVTPWAGDDWHNWGFADVEAAIAAIPAWIDRVKWTGPDVDINRWIVAGHSNGGQGTWYAMTHRPDKIVAAAPVSGYASIQKYVSYDLWQPADPRRTAVVGASLKSYRHEMLMANVRGIPIQQQHGAVDDNVPTYHSRFLAQQLHLSGARSNYSEVPKQNHWWEGVMTTSQLVDFYHSQARNEDVLPRKLDEFTIVVGDPGDMGSKSGIGVLQLDDPGQYGKVDVKGHNIKTTNVVSLEFDNTIWTDTITVDGQTLDVSQATAHTIVHNLGSEQMRIMTEAQQPTGQRSGRQLGSMTAILRTHGPFLIRHPAIGNTSHVALQISRNLHQYFQADAGILSSFSDSVVSNATGNIITLAIGDNIPNFSSEVGIYVHGTQCDVVDQRGRIHEYGEAARGAAFLRPAGGERLELVIWGADEEGLRQAARVVPMLTGVGQPDFVVFGESAKWRGIEGALAMGFFDWAWEVTGSSVL
jgi:predicted peptidase